MEKKANKQKTKNHGKIVRKKWPIFHEEKRAKWKNRKWEPFASG